MSNNLFIIVFSFLFFPSFFLSFIFLQAPMAPPLLALALVALALSAGIVFGQSGLSADDSAFISSCADFLVARLSALSGGKFPYFLTETHSATVERQFAQLAARREELRQIPFQDPYSGRLSYRAIRVPVDYPVNFPILHRVNLEVAVAFNSSDGQKQTSNPITLIATVLTDGDGFRSISQLRSSPRDFSTGRSVIERIRLGGLTEEKVTFSSTFSVVSANLWNYNYWFQRVPLLFSSLSSLSGDLLGFQEVRLRALSGKHRIFSERSQIHQLMDILPDYEFVYEPAMGFREFAEPLEEENQPINQTEKVQQAGKFRAEGKFKKMFARNALGHQPEMEFVFEGLAIFSRFPIEEARAVKLSRDPEDSGDFHQRILLHATVNRKQENSQTVQREQKIHALTSHLSLSQAARDRTLREIGHYSKEAKTSCRNSGAQCGFVLLGDFNVGDNSGEVGLDELSRKFHWRDAWTVEGARRGFSEPSNHPDRFTFNSWEMKSRIDYLFFQSPLSLEGFLISGSESSEVPDFWPGRGGVENLQGKMFPSDHRFIKATLKFDDSLENTEHAEEPVSSPSFPPLSDVPALLVGSLSSVESLESSSPRRIHEEL